MRAVFINHCHPGVPHVCGLRAGRFAEALAARGHEIVLLSEVLHPGDFGLVPGDLPAALANHDWRLPFVLPCRPHGYERIVRARHGQLPEGWRQMVIAWSYAKHGGMFPDWQAGAASYFPILAETFRPDVVWGTFGNTDTWRLCQGLAARAGCPWVADFKDNWAAFVPSGLHTLMAARFGDAAGMTVYSCAHCDQADVLFPRTMKTVLYSGVDAVGDVTPPSGGDAVTLTLTGSVYDQALLAELLAAVDTWAARHPSRETVLHYAGNDGEAVAAASLGCRYRLKLEGYLPQDELHALQSDASANLYVHNPRCLMHHKALELIAMGRPVISYPGETDEVKDLAAEVGGSLFAAANGQEAVEALAVAVDNPPPVPARSRREAFTWGHRAGVLEKVLGDAAAKAAATGRRPA